MSSARDLSDIEDDEALFEELEKEEDADMSFFREQRIKEIQEEMERRRAMEENKHGLYTEIEKEKEFMDITLKEKYVVGHFFHKDFRRCKIMDTHLEELAKKHYGTRFVKIDVMNAPFLVEKLQVKVLPCVMAWVEGYAKIKLIGFDDLGNTDGFSTSLLEFKLANAGALKKKVENADNKPQKSIFQSRDEDYDSEDD
ncbi:hypothetical protein EC973_009215 [Apophysomyces ossiformis]|uniref:Thioredoxin domain-containing protein n=1 Tax=Apophysomyces ossiformis TaxID=679940 RepID=A0A8H7EPQ0_9FUNG|nr:hypothetical protein EC973_009215 [Apophysomyces ossiformis]